MKLSKKDEEKLVKHLTEKYGEHKWTVEQKIDAMLELFKSKITITQARKDLEYLKIHYGEPNDFCGSFCNCEILESILMGRKTIKDAIIDNIKYYFSNGLDSMHDGCSSDLLPDLEDSRVQRIMDRYDIYL